VRHVLPAQGDFESAPLARFLPNRPDRRHSGRRDAPTRRGKITDHARGWLSMTCLGDQAVRPGAAVSCVAGEAGRRSSLAYCCEQRGGALSTEIGRRIAALLVLRPACEGLALPAENRPLKRGDSNSTSAGDACALRLSWYGLVLRRRHERRPFPGER
jgi:hypothetical protein